MRNRFDEQLEKLNAELITMGALCEQAITIAINALLYGNDDDKVQFNKVHETEREIDQKERDIENLCMRLLLQQQPVAGDLRKISSALKMISDMERIGDQASDISDITMHIRFENLRSKVHISDSALSPQREAPHRRRRQSSDPFWKSLKLPWPPGPWPPSANGLPPPSVR